MDLVQLCAGCVRVKNVTNTLLMNAVDCCVAGVCFYLLGYGVAFGTGADGAGNAFIGTGDFALSASAQNGLKWHLWLFHCAQPPHACAGCSVPVLPSTPRGATPFGATLQGAPGVHSDVAARLICSKAAGPVFRPSTRASEARCALQGRSCRRS